MSLRASFIVFIVLLISILSLTCSSPTRVKENVKQQTFEKKKINQQIVKELPTPKKYNVIWGKNRELTSEEIIQNRKMSLYNQKYFDCAEFRLKTVPKTNCDENEMQNLIWQNWLDKRRTHVVITRNSVDSISSEHIFIEPDETGNWCVVWKIATKHNMSVYDNQIINRAKAVSVERIKDKPKKGKWALVFKDANGSNVEKIPDFTDPLTVRD